MCVEKNKREEEEESKNEENSSPSSIEIYRPNREIFNASASPSHSYSRSPVFLQRRWYFIYGDIFRHLLYQPPPKDFSRAILNAPLVERGKEEGLAFVAIRFQPGRFCNEPSIGTTF